MLILTRLKVSFIQNQNKNLTGDQLAQLQSEFEKVSSAYEEELEATDGLRGQLGRLQAEFLSLKSKYEKDLAGKADEAEEIRFGRFV